MKTLACLLALTLSAPAIAGPADVTDAEIEIAYSHCVDNLAMQSGGPVIGRALKFTPGHEYCEGVAVERDRRMAARATGPADAAAQDIAARLKAGQ